MLKIKNLTAGYADLPILKEVSLELRPGTMAVLMGPNGAGKSTLLKSVFNLTTITSGEVFFKGERVTQVPANQLVRRGLAFVSQGKINFATLSVRDNLLLGAYFERDKNKVEIKIKEVYAQFPVLKDKQTAYAFSLSGGEQQMLAIGRALMSAQQLLLLDEPSL